jgi:hypothetical protein
MKSVIKHIAIGLLLGVYLCTTAIGRIQVFRLALCSPDSIAQESPSSKPKNIDPRPTWNSRRQISTSIKVELPDDITLVHDASFLNERETSVIPVHVSIIPSYTYFTQSSPRAPPVA